MLSPTIITSSFNIDTFIHPNFIIVYSLDNNKPATFDSFTASILVNDAINKFSSHSAFSLVTDAVCILTNGALEKIDSILASILVTDAESILVNDSIDKVSSTSPSSLVTDQWWFQYYCNNYCNNFGIFH